MPSVYLINEMDKDFVDKCAGKEVKIPPGKAAKVPDYIAYHFIGDPRVLNGPDEFAKAAEEKRVAMRYAAFKPEDRDLKIPKLRIEPIEEVEVEIVDLKGKETVSPSYDKELGEEEFPELRQPPEETIKTPVEAPKQPKHIKKG